MTIDIDVIIQRHFQAKHNCSSLSGLTEMLQAYSSYGMYYIIVPFIEEVHILCEKETSEMIDGIIQSLPDAAFIKATVANYHKEMLQSYGLAETIDMNSEKLPWYFEHTNSAARTFSTVWESYDTARIQYIEDNRKKNVGLWTPGLFSNKVDQSFLHKLNKYSLAAIDEAINYHRAHYASDSWLPDIISEQIHIMVEELAAHYYVGVDLAQFDFFNMNVCEFVRLPGTELKDHLFLQKKLQYPYFDYNEEWVQALEKLCEMAESWFGSKRPDATDTLMFHIPLLYQLINQEEIAEDKLMFQVENNQKLNTAACLMSCTIALAKTRNNNIRNRISSYLEEVYYINRNNGHVRKYLALLDETVDFFSTYFNHIRNYINDRNKNWKQFKQISMKKRLELSGQISGDESFLWIYENLIENDMFIKAFYNCKAKIQESVSPLTDVEHIFEQSLNLFYTASSHIEKYPRIVGNQLLMSLGQSGLSNRYYEVLYTERYYDKERHQALYDRFQSLRSELPSQKYACWARNIIHEFCQGEVIITKELISACAKISNNPVDYPAVDENRFNREIRNLLEAPLNHLGYSICDQKQQGLGNTGTQPGEVDILIQKAGLPIAIYEGLLHWGNDWLKGHIEKAITRYNYSGCKTVYIVDFMQNGIGGNNWKKAMNTMQEYPGIDIIEISTGLNGIRMAEGTFQWGDSGFGKIVFIGVNCARP